MLTTNARKTFLSGLSPINYNSSTGVVSADTSILATQFDLTSNFDTVRVVPYTSTGIVLLRANNDSLRPKPLIAGSNITLTQNSDSTVTIASTGGGSSNSNVGTGFRVAVSATNNIKTLFGTANQITIDSSSNTNALTFTLPSTVSITNLTTSGTNTMSGVTYAGSALSTKLDVMVQDTTTNILSRRSAQFVDTTGIASGKIVYWNGSNFAVETNTGGSTSFVDTIYRTVGKDSIQFTIGGRYHAILDSAGGSGGGSGTVTSVATGLGLSGGTITTTGTIILDTSYAVTKSTTQLISGNKTFSGLHFLTGILNDTASLTKTKVLVQDTTNGKVYNYGFQTIDTTGQVDGYAVKWSSSVGHFIVASGVKFQHTIFTPTTGNTIALNNNQENIINPAGTLSTLTMTLPSTPANNDIIYLTFTQAITTITYSGGTVAGGRTSAAIGNQWHLTYDSGTSTWY
jgi:hypothetical protein